MQGHSRSEAQPDQHHCVQSPRRVEWDPRVHLQQWGDQGHWHDHAASVPQEDPTPGEAGPHGVQVRTRPCAPLQALSSSALDPRGREEAQCKGASNHILIPLETWIVLCVSLPRRSFVVFSLVALQSWGGVWRQPAQTLMPVLKEFVNSVGLLLNCKVKYRES